MMPLMRGWSGATPYRMSPYGAGWRSNRSIDTSVPDFMSTSAA